MIDPTQYDVDFERPLKQLAYEIFIMRQEGGELENPTRIYQATEELYTRMQEIYSNLSTRQTTQVARHKKRPRATDYIRLLCDDFHELYADDQTLDKTLTGGPATFNGETVMFLIYGRTRGTQNRELRARRMSHAEEHRKAYHLMQMAGKFKFPVICFIDSPEAVSSPTVEKWSRSGVSAANLFLMAHLPVPVITVIIGEAGKDAPAIGCVDRLLMLEYSVYTLAEPDVSAFIIQSDTTRAFQPAGTARFSARELRSAHLIDELISEPVGGAHRNAALAASYLQISLKEHLQVLKQYSTEELIAMRTQKLPSIFSR